jgi:pilus assembly protein CpaF
LVLDEILGYGPLEPLLMDDSVQEIFVNGANQVWVERFGQVVESDVRFLNEEHLQRTSARMAAQMGRKLDRRWPMLDGRLPDGSRVNIVGPPCVVNGTSITIRKYSKSPLTLSTLVQYGTLSDELADFLHSCILGRLNIMIAGGSGAGKTTLLNALASFIPENERVVTIEESAELRLDQRHVVPLEVRTPDLEGTSATGSISSASTTMSQGQVTGEVGLRHLLANALRMRAERILLGEMVGAEALDLLMAMNTGHDGVMTTIHATTPRDALLHAEAMALMSGTHLPLSRIRSGLATGIDLIIQVARLRDGTRRVIYVTEVRGMEGERIALKDLFGWHEIADEDTGMSSGILQATGEMPRFIYRLQDRGQKINREIFLGRDEGAEF